MTCFRKVKQVKDRNVNAPFVTPCSSRCIQMVWISVKFTEWIIIGCLDKGSSGCTSRGGIVNGQAGVYACVDYDARNGFVFAGWEFSGWENVMSWWK